MFRVDVRLAASDDLAMLFLVHGAVDEDGCQTAEDDADPDCDECESGLRC
jgi:hypothetical protein